MKIRGFGKTADGRSASLCVLRNSAGAEAHVTNYGATLVRLIVPDRNGRMTDVVLGHDDVNGYESGEGYLGATVGRFANRIGGACFTLNGKTYELTANDGPNTLHSGRDFYSKRLWDVKMPFIRRKDGILTSDNARSPNSSSKFFLHIFNENRAIRFIDIYLSSWTRLVKVREYKIYCTLLIVNLLCLY